MSVRMAPHLGATTNLVSMRRLQNLIMAGGHMACKPILRSKSPNLAFLVQVMILEACNHVCYFGSNMALHDSVHTWVHHYVYFSGRQGQTAV